MLISNEHPRIAMLFCSCIHAFVLWSDQILVQRAVISILLDSVARKKLGIRRASCAYDGYDVRETADEFRSIGKKQRDPSCLISDGAVKVFIYKTLGVFKYKELRCENMCFFQCESSFLWNQKCSCTKVYYQNVLK